MRSCSLSFNSQLTNRAQQKAFLPTSLVLFLSSACSAIRTKELHAEKAFRKNQNGKQKTSKIQSNHVPIKGFSSGNRTLVDRKFAVAERITV